MEICNCYNERAIGGKIYSECWGTKEKEPCACQGDKSNCDFYTHSTPKTSKNSAGAPIKEGPELYNNTTTTTTTTTTSTASVPTSASYFSLVFWNSDLSTAPECTTLLVCIKDTSGDTSFFYITTAWKTPHDDWIVNNELFCGTIQMWAFLPQELRRAY